jgi:hypothetical protein
MIRLLCRPAPFGLAVMLVHLLLVLPMLARRDFDSSVFIVAGDRFVTTAQTPSPVIVRPNSAGYDGQFYYRFALAPLLPDVDAFGVRLDHPAWRMQRVVYPTLAHLLAGGRAAGIPAMLFLLNLAGLFAIGWIAMGAAHTHGWPLAVPVAIATWPGLLIALTHDTTEILAAALLLAACAAWLYRRWATVALFIALASLTRETAILAGAGLCAVQLWRLVRPSGSRRDYFAAAWSVAALMPFLIWRHVITLLWRDSPQAHGVAHNAGWPVAGWVQALLANLLNRPVGFAGQPRDLSMRVTMVAGIFVLAWFSLRTMHAARAAMRRNETAGLAAAWLLILALMLVLTANGPLVDPTAYFRAFTECWVLGWLLLGLTATAPRQPGWLLLVGLPLLVRQWELCWIQLR